MKLHRISISGATKTERRPLSAHSSFLSQEVVGWIFQYSSPIDRDDLVHRLEKALAICPWLGARLDGGEKSALILDETSPDHVELWNCVADDAASMMDGEDAVFDNPFLTEVAGFHDDEIKGPIPKKLVRFTLIEQGEQEVSSSDSDPIRRPSAFAVVWNHALCDGIAMMRFLTILSQIDTTGKDAVFKQDINLSLADNDKNTQQQQEDEVGQSEGGNNNSLALPVKGRKTPSNIFGFRPAASTSSSGDDNNFLGVSALPLPESGPSIMRLSKVEDNKIRQYKQNLLNNSAKTSLVLEKEGVGYISSQDILVAAYWKALAKSYLQDKGKTGDWIRQTDPKFPLILTINTREITSTEAPIHHNFTTTTSEPFLLGNCVMDSCIPYLTISEVGAKKSLLELAAAIRRLVQESRTPQMVHRVNQALCQGMEENGVQYLPGGDPIGLLWVDWNSIIVGSQPVSFFVGVVDNKAISSPQRPHQFGPCMSPNTTTEDQEGNSNADWGTMVYFLPGAGGSGQTMYSPNSPKCFLDLLEQDDASAWDILFGKEH